MSADPFTVLTVNSWITIEICKVFFFPQVFIIEHLLCTQHSAL